MKPNAPSIRPGARVRLHLEVHLDDGTEVLSTLDEEPLDLAVGDGTLTPATEELLIGLCAGDDQRLSADGNELFGQWMEENLHWIARGDFPVDITPAPGLLVAFDTPGGAETAGMVKEVQGDRVQVDFNHPLSGRPLRIHVQVLDVGAPDQADKTH